MTTKILTIEQKDKKINVSMEIKIEPWVFMIWTLLVLTVGIIIGKLI